jgi:hypothetical protein
MPDNKTGTQMKVEGTTCFSATDGRTFRIELLPLFLLPQFNFLRMSITHWRATNMNEPGPVGRSASEGARTAAL